MQGRDVILGLLCERDHTGYGIKEMIETQLQYFFDGTSGMIYPTLKKLEKEGKVTKQTVVQLDRPNKNVYSITPAGREDFMRYLSSEVDEEIIKSDFLMRLYFDENFKESRVRSLIEEELARKKVQLEKLGKNITDWQKNGMSEGQSLAYRYGRAYYEAMGAMLEKFLEEM